MHKLHILGALLALASCNGEPAIAADLPERIVSLVKAEGADRVVIMVGSSESTDVQALHEAHPDAFCSDARSILRFFDNRDLDGHAILFSGSAIYRLRPCSEEVARLAAHQIGDPRPVVPMSFRLAAPERDYDDHDLEDVD